MDLMLRGVSTLTLENTEQSRALYLQCPKHPFGFPIFVQSSHDLIYKPSLK